METQKKLELIEEVMDLEEGAPAPETLLADLDCWDSMTKLALIVMMDDECDKRLSGDTIRSFKTVQDIMDFMD